MSTGRMNPARDDTRRLTRLLQLASPALPVGGYSYSQGLEWAVESGDVRDAASAARWIEGVMAGSVARFEAPLLVRCLRAARAIDAAALAEWNALHLASRESAELRAEAVQMGYSLAGLLGDLSALPPALADALRALEPPSYPAAFAVACAGWDIGDEHAVTAYVWSWLENQVMAALKSVPLGQVAGQAMLGTLAGGIPALVECALTLEDDALSNFAPGLAIASSRHETQYSRLFRS